MSFMAMILSQFCTDLMYSSSDHKAKDKNLCFPHLN